MLPWPNWTEQQWRKKLKVAQVAKGGPGSGNFGHAGRPGEVGGSSSEGGTWTSDGGWEHTGISWKQDVDPKTGRPIPIHVKSVEEAVELVLDGKVVEVDTPGEAHTLINRLAARAIEMKNQGEDAKDFDLCNVTVKNTNMFCSDSLRSEQYPHGVPRLLMPQLGGTPRPGSEADKLPRKAGSNEVDGADAFVTYLQGIGMRTSNERVPAANLRASQRELIGTKVAGIMNATSFDPGETPIFVSSDDYVVDGHHRWAAVVGRDAEDGVLGQSTMNIRRINAPISEVLHIANTWANKFGIQQVAGVAAQGKKTGLRKGDLPGHEFHGNQWTGGGGSAAREQNVRSAQTETPEFKQWFGGSAVVNDDGTPRVMYHSTTKDIHAFHQNTHFGTKEAATDVADRNSQFFEAAGLDFRDTGLNVMPVYLKIENPLRMPDLAVIDNETGDPLPDDWDNAGPDSELHYPRGWEGEEAVSQTLLEMGVIDIDEFEDNRSNNKAFRLLSEKGYDGIVYQNAIEDTGKDSYIAFSPKQVKSALGNRGTFDPESADITKGDLPGHEFHGNQWTTGSGGAATVERPTVPSAVLDAIHQADGGFTYHAVTGDQPKTGYALSLHKDRERVIPSAAKVTVADLAKYTLDNADLLMKDNNYLGGWHNPNDGKAYLDVSTVVESAEEAERLGRDHQQLAYFDLDRGRSVEITSKGRRHGEETYFQSHRTPEGAADAGRFDRVGPTTFRPGTDTRRNRHRTEDPRRRTQESHFFLNLLGRIEKYSDDQPRDESGRWTDGGGGGTASTASEVRYTRPLTEADWAPGSDAKHVRPSEARLTEVRGQLRQFDVEHAVIFRRDGYVEEYIGDKSGVSLPGHGDYTDAALVHNHPDYEVSLSIGDLYTVSNLNLKSMEAVTKDGTFILERQVDVWPFNFTGRLEQINSEIYRRDMNDPIFRGKSAVERAIAHQNERVQKLADAFPNEVSYQFKKAS